jgi:hypothetical protein
MTRLTCPYCYNDFPARRVEYRCTGLKGRNGKQCGTSRDQILFTQLGVTEALPPPFKARGFRSEARCPHCENGSPHRICPHCHSQLPVHFGRVDSRMVAMIGAKYSGKTVYTTVLLHELMHRVGGRLDAAVVGSDERTRQAFNGDQSQLYDEGVLFDTTATANASRRPPLVFKVSRSARGRFLDRQRHTLMSFFDTAGEDLKSEESVRLNVRYLRGAGAVILLLDPLQMPGALLGTGARPPDATPSGVKVDQPIDVLARITDLLFDAGHGGPSKLIDIPVAVAFSKIDALWNGLPPGSPIRQPAPDVAGYGRRDGEAVHEHVRALLYAWEAGQIDQFLTKHYRNFRYFGLSALGAEPSDGRKVSDRGIQPHRVEDPFLWLLSNFKVIPTAED